MSARNCSLFAFAYLLLLLPAAVLAECQRSDTDAALFGCVCPAAKEIEVTGQALLPGGSIPPFSAQPGVGPDTGGSTTFPDGSTICHLQGAPDPTTGVVPTCKHTQPAPGAPWISTGSCGQLGGGVPNWCKRGKSTLPAAAQADINADIAGKLASACDCPVVNNDRRCGGTCAPDPANPPERQGQRNGRKDKRTTITKNPNGTLAVTVRETWEIHCKGDCAMPLPAAGGENCYEESFEEEVEYYLDELNGEQ